MRDSRRSASARGCLYGRLCAIAAALGLLLGAETAVAQGVTFSVTALPRNVRQDGLTEAAGELAIMAFSSGTVPAGSTIDVAFSAPITNNTSASTGNISLANNLSCNSAACPSSAALVGSQTIRLSFATDRAFSVTQRMDLVRVRVDANAVAPAATITATVTAVSANPVNNPIDFFSTPTRTVANVGPSVIITPNPGGNAVKPFFTCTFTSGSSFSVRLSGPLTSLLEETMLSNHAPVTNGTSVRLTITGVPVGLTLDTPTTAVGDLLPTDGGTFVSTGAPVVLNYTVATSSGGFAAATLPLVLTITGGGPTLPPLGTTANIQAAAQVLPITATDTVIPRLVANSYGPTTAATLGDCRARPKGLLVSE